MQSWQLQDAKAKFSEVVRRAAQTPQVVTVHGREEVVVIAKSHYDRLTHATPNLVDFLQSSPLHGIDIDLPRDRALPRDIDL